MAAKQVLHNFPVLRTTALLPRARASTTAISSVSAGPPPPMPPAMPQQWDFAMPPQEMPVRVPFLPENDFARYHRHKYVPSVAPPHDPVISTLINSPESTLTAAAKEMLSDMFQTSAGAAPRSGQKERQASIGVRTVNTVQETEEERKSLEMTDEKKVFLQSFAGGAVAWWVFGEPIMRGFGIL